MAGIDPANSSLPDRIDRQSAFSSLRHRDFRLLWMGQIVSVTGSQMQLAAINWHIYLLTRSALALGLVGACRAVPRSEEHTSELQSHGLISYAVFCLKKKKKK